MSLSGKPALGSTEYEAKPEVTLVRANPWPAGCEVVLKNSFIQALTVSGYRRGSAASTLGALVTPSVM